MCNNTINNSDDHDDYKDDDDAFNSSSGVDRAPFLLAAAR
jgi:hypothetical protein